jgi:hypothetical protein
MTTHNPIEAGYLASLFGETIYLVDESVRAEQAAPVAVVKSVTEANPVEAVVIPTPVLAEPEPVKPVVKPTVAEIVLPPAPVEKVTIPKVEVPKAPEIVLPKAAEKPVTEIAPFKFMGENKKEVLILTEDKNQEYISDTDAILLGKILTAVGLTLNDVALVNIASYQNLDWMKLRTEVKYRYMIAFTPSAALLHKNLQIPLYTTKRTNTLDFLISDTLASLEQSIEQKKKLWGNLKGFLPTI